MKTTNICKTKPNETQAWFRSFFTQSVQETDLANATAPVAHTQPSNEITNNMCDPDWIQYVFLEDRCTS